MFGIGLPEMILILGLALIVVGPDKLPELARSIAKGVMELKKTAEGLKESLTEDGNPLDIVKPELEDAARTLKDKLGDTESLNWDNNTPAKALQDAYSQYGDDVIDAEHEPLVHRDEQDEQTTMDASSEAESTPPPPVADSDDTVTPDKSATS